jgi:hypothetical protein
VNHTTRGDPEFCVSWDDSSGPVELPREAPLTFERVAELFDAPLGLAVAADATPEAGEQP